MTDYQWSENRVRSCDQALHDSLLKQLFFGNHVRSPQGGSAISTLPGNMPLSLYCLNPLWIPHYPCIDKRSGLFHGMANMHYEPVENSASFSWGSKSPNSKHRYMYSSSVFSSEAYSRRLNRWNRAFQETETTFMYRPAC